MLFHVYGDMAAYQWIAMLGVLWGLILLNEFARRTKFGGIVTFFAVPLALTAYFIAIRLAFHPPLHSCSKILPGVNFCIPFS